MGNLRWSYMDHWRVDTARGPVTQYHSRRQMDDFVKQIAAVGFEGLDMFDFQVFALTEMFGSPTAYQRYLNDHGIAKIVNLFRGIMYDPRVADPHTRSTHDEIVESTRRMLGMWQSLEIESLIVMPGGLYIDAEPVTDDTIKAAAECWSRVGEMSLEEFGVRTTGHHEFFCSIRTQADILTFYEWADPRYVSFLCDTAQHCIAGVDPVDLYETLHDRVSGFHFKDTRERDTTEAYRHRPDAELMAPQTDRWFYEMGTDGGLVDFPRLMEALSAATGSAAGSRWSTTRRTSVVTTRRAPRCRCGTPVTCWRRSTRERARRATPGLRDLPVEAELRRLHAHRAAPACVQGAGRLRLHRRRAPGGHRQVGPARPAGVDSHELRVGRGVRRAARRDRHHRRHELVLRPGRPDRRGALPRQVDPRGRPPRCHRRVVPRARGAPGGRRG